MRYVDFRCLETSRLMLRDIRMEDIQEYYERLFGDGDVAKYMLFDPHQDIGESYQSIQKILEQYAQGRFYRWGIALKEDDSLIGVIQLLRFDEETNTCSFAYMLGRDYWNQGYATEALSKVVSFAFDEMEIQRIVVDHVAENGASGAVMRKVGMKHIGTERGGFVKHGLVHDLEVYELCNRKPLTGNEYQRLAMMTLNPAMSDKDVLINSVMGLCGEAGEAIDLVKKHLYQGHDLDKKVLAKELGDIAWYLAEAAHALGMPLEDILWANVDKLKKRYPEGFDQEKSIRREA